ncbi:LytR family transcriptional regulator, partial [Campylobacter jejuni]|nr:LytR family transcriptional regulator [Campylobacter jejuni]
MPSNNQNHPDDRSIRSSATIPSRRETYRNQKTRKAQKQRHAKASSKRRGCFFWTLLVIVVTLIFGGHYAYKKYISAKKAADSIYNSSNITKARDVNSTLKDGHPISVLLMGTDTGALGRTFKGRTDTMIVAVLNPEKKKMTVVSLPRDVEVAISGHEEYFPSKLNSAYEYGGSATAVKTVQKYL